MNKNFTNIFKEIDKKNKFNLKIGLCSFLNQLTGVIAACGIFLSFPIILINISMKKFFIDELWFIPIILLTGIISYIFEKKEEELKNKMCNQKIKIFEENIQMDNNFLKTFLQGMGESKMVHDFLIIFEKKERTIEEKEKMVDFIINKEKNDINSIKRQEENKKINNIKEKYNLYEENQELEINSQEMKAKYNL
jgi:hypothetical protein